MAILTSDKVDFKPRLIRKDKNRPLHPNQVIEKILQTYMHKTLCVQLYQKGQ